MGALSRCGCLAIIVDHVGRAGTDCWVNASIKGKLNIEVAVLSCKDCANFGGTSTTHGLGRNQRDGLTELETRSMQAGPSAETGLG
jgi:hypothetical protein